VRLAAQSMTDPENIKAVLVSRLRNS